MSRKTFSILFFIKKSKLNRNGEAPIYMRITIDGERSETSIKRSIDQSRWNNDKGAARARSNFEQDLNQYLKHITHQVYLKQQELEEQNRVISAKSLMNAYLNKDDDDRRTILQVYDEHNVKLKLLVGKGVAYNTYKRHITSRGHLGKFIREKYEMRDYYLKDINPEFVDRFDTYFRVDRGCNNNTTVKYIANFAKIIRHAMTNEWIQTNPLRKLQLKIDPVDKEYLNQEELEKIQLKSISCERIAQVRDIFVFCCFTGLAYVDAHALTYDNIETGSNGAIRLRIKRQKTGQPARGLLLIWTNENDINLKSPSSAKSTMGGNKYANKVNSICSDCQTL
ncbi:phage integrase SAM-like domain-containing protein [Bacteroidota bacterium]